MEDISQVVKNYYAVIGQKDEDIFELYRDNKRLKKQLNEVLTTEEERQTELCTTRLLVATLQTELREKQLLIEAHQAESAAFRNAEWRLREVLHMPSELDYTIEDVIDACTNFHDECFELRAQQEQLIGVAKVAWSFGCYMLVEAEENARKVMTDACDCAYIAMTRLLRCTRQAIIEKEELHKIYRETECERHYEMELMMRRAQVERCQQERILEEWKEQVVFSDNRLFQLQQSVRNAQAEKELLLEAACSRLNITMERGADAERMFLQAFRTVIRHDAQLQNARIEAVTLRAKVEKMQSDFLHARTLLQRKQNEQQQLRLEGGDGENNTATNKKNESDDDDDGGGSNNNTNKKKKKSNNDDNINVHHAFCTLQMEYDALKAEWQKCTERERLTRQHAATTINKLKAERSVCEKTVAECQGRCSRVEKALQRTQLEVRRHAKEAKRLQNLYDALREEAKSYVERICSLEEMNRLLKEENTILASRVKTLQEVTSEKEEAIASAERTAHNRYAELQKQLRDDNKKFVDEIKAWTLSLEETRKKVTIVERERDREKMLREMLLEQYRDEERMFKKLMEEEHKKAIGELNVKIDTLEGACRRGAAVIAELREALHRANTKNNDS